MHVAELPIAESAFHEILFTTPNLDAIANDEELSYVSVVRLTGKTGTRISVSRIAMKSAAYIPI